MEKKKMKLWKKILIVVLILFTMFMINVTRKAIILSSIDKKVTALENNNHNIYVKTIFGHSEYKSQIERFIKDDVEKLVIEKTDQENGTVKIIQITYPNERKVYTEDQNNKVMYTYKEKAPIRGAHIEMTETGRAYTNALANVGYTTNLQERMLSSIMNKIRTVEVDGKKCYELSILYDLNFLCDQNIKELSVLVDKETGLVIRNIEKIKKDGKIEERITNYEYKFNEVTDKDMEEPDSTQYIKGK